MQTRDYDLSRSKTFEPYVIGETYKGKGIYLGESKGAYKFQRHTAPFYQRQQFGPRYHFEAM